MLSTFVPVAFRLAKLILEKFHARPLPIASSLQTIAKSLQISLQMESMLMTRMAGLTMNE